MFFDFGETGRDVTMHDGDFGFEVTISRPYVANHGFEVNNIERTLFDSLQNCPQAICDFGNSGGDSSVTF